MTADATDDPRQLAVERFDAPDTPERAARGLGIIGTHATDPPLVIGGLLDALAPAATPGARICEMGFGSGWLLEEMITAFPAARVVGLDMSESLTRAAHRWFGGPAAIVRGDMEAPPFREGSLDAVVTCFTLYFMRDIDAALDAIARCLRPGGRFVAATVAADNMREYTELAGQAARTVGAEPEADISDRFDLASGRAYVERHFDDLTLVEWHGELALDDPGLLLELWRPYGVTGLTDDEDGRTREEFARLCREHITRHGPLRITRHSGAFVGRTRR